MSKIVSIFDLVKDQLYAVQYEDDDTDIFHKTFTLWTDVEYLENFFELQQEKLNQERFGSPTVEEAVEKTLEEAEEFQEKIWNASEERGNLGQFVFRNLHKNDYSTQHIESKAYGPNNPSWLRIYALCISQEIYIITGGGIKLTKTMQASTALDKELRRLKQVKDYLKENGIFEDSDIGYIELGNHEGE